MRKFCNVLVLQASCQVGGMRQKNSIGKMIVGYKKRTNL